MLLAAMELHGQNFDKVSELVPGRTKIQCRDRYINVLDPSLKPPTSWTYDEDKKLLQLTQQPININEQTGIYPYYVFSNTFNDFSPYRQL